MFEKLIYSAKSLLNKPFKVGIISPQYLDKASNQGVAIHTYYLSEGLAKLGCDVHVFTMGEKDSIKTEFIGEGRRIVHKINVNSGLPQVDPTLKRKLGTFMFDSLILTKIFNENAKEKFDIMHSQITMNSGLISKYFTDAKWIHTFHSLERLRVKYTSKENKRYMGIVNWMQSNVTYPDAIISVSEDLRKDILKAYPTLKGSRVFNIPNGVDLETFKPNNEPLKDKRVLFIARFSMEKGIDIVEKISRRVLKEDSEIKIELIVPIDNYLSESMEKIKKRLEATEKEFPERFIWHKTSVDREKLNEIYNQCTVYIQPSRYESFGMTVLEAMACGKATIVSNRGGMPEIVRDGGMVIPLNTKLFVTGILRLMGDYRLRERYSRKAIKRAENFSWEDISKRTLELYKIIAKRKEADETEKIEEAMKGLDRA